ncbi:MAG: hypothetical protein QF890_07140 [Myxococcota bacterium]|nr:hypothetical protein [bacterium]MDP6242055.1 hypothetical protein [Myxococcota bacterium]MDP7074162.1 hypothetical protein [Myxococcota bacterium]MDP7299831.1 hypothetical protein [Myxococcota bacterium]MDP7432330.1 hypothetical protein [Myxococcota bacterium]
MRRSFGRRRGGRSNAPKPPAIDAKRWFERLTAEGHVHVAALEPIASDGVPAGFAALGAGESEAGERVLVGFSPTNGGDAALAVLAHAAELASDGNFSGKALAIAPRWPSAARRRLARVGQVGFEFCPLEVPSLGADGGAVEPERSDLPRSLPVDLLAATCEPPEGPDLFRRALRALEGLAAKHGGVVRGTGQGAELVLLARRCALLRPEAGGVVLETLRPDKASTRLEADLLAGALDRLEGQLRKRLNDRRVRGGEEGLRGSAVGALAAAAELRNVCSWPLAGDDPDVIDQVGLDPEGRPVVAVVRERLDLPAVGAVLDVLDALQAALPGLFIAAGLRPATPRLAFAAREIDATVAHLFGALAFDHAFYEIRGRTEVVLRDQSEAALPQKPEAVVADGETQALGSREPERTAPRRRRRRGGRGQRQGKRVSSDRPEARESDSETPAPAEETAQSAEVPEAIDEASSIDEISLFDLDDEPRREAAGSGTRPARRRGRRQGGRSRVRAPDNDAEDTAADTGDAKTADDDLVAEDAHDLAATLAPLDESALGAPIPGYDDEEDGAAEGGDDWMRERDLRQRARAAEIASEPVVVHEEESAPVAPRRRSAIVAHADRSSVIAAVLLAREIRLVEGFWVYPQEELMTFFRGVATDLRADVPIHIVGFHAKPARATVQAASLYSGRLYWYDHHDWPPEDLESMRNAIGEGYVEVQSGSGSSIAAVLARRARRSRFSDKLVELATGRFSQHDYERWGRYWWHRISELTRETGEKRREIEPLLAGRPSDLAKATAGAPLPPLPAEVPYVSERDFRVVHSGGFGLVVVPVPPDIDPHMTARLARERFAAQVSLTYVEGEDLVMLGGEESRGHQSLDLSAMVAHLAAKHDWIEPRRDEDHVARLHIHELAQRPERLDEVVGAVATGRSILEG